MKKGLFLLVCIVFSSVLLSAGGHQDSNPEPGSASGEGRTIKVSYNIEKTNAGTRSEGRSHVLTINGYTLPDVFSLVYATDSFYDFKVAGQVWDDAGYVLDRDKKGDAPYGETASVITDEDWELGWYENSRRKEGTPRSWVYVERDSLKAFVNPDEIDRFVAYTQLSEIPRLGLETKK